MPVLLFDPNNNNDQAHLPRLAGETLNPETP
jgi:hypothetical protein